MMPRVLVGCESSGIVRDAFARIGCAAMSCDLLPSEAPGPHYQGDILELLDGPGMWDLVIVHPEYTKMTVSGNHVYAAGKPRHHERVEAVRWTEKLWSRCREKGKRVALENPVGVLPTMSCLPKPQYVQPYQFGEDASKKTALFLHGLPGLRGTKRVYGRMVEWPRGSGKWVERWANQTDSGQNKLSPGPDRWKDRSRTYHGIADAMAMQWGAILLVEAWGGGV